MLNVMMNGTPKAIAITISFIFSFYLSFSNVFILHV